MPNLLPGSVLNFQLDWMPAAGRLIWSVIFTTLGLVWIMALLKRPAVKSLKAGPGILVGGVVSGSAMVIAGKTIFDSSLTGDTLVPFGFMIAWIAFVSGLWATIMSVEFKQINLPLSNVKFFSAGIASIFALYIFGGIAGQSFEPIAYITAWLILVVAFVLITLYLLQLPPRVENATWAETVFGVVYMFVMMTLIYALIPHEWITFATSYLGFTKDAKVSTGGEFILQTWLNGNIWSKNSRIIPFEINLEIIQDHATIALYVITAWMNIMIFSAWQKRNQPIERNVEKAQDEKPAKTSRFGRPVKNLKASKA